MWCHILRSSVKTRTVFGYSLMYSRETEWEIHIVQQLHPRHPLRFRFVGEQRQRCLSYDGTEARRETRMVIEGNKVAKRKLQTVTWTISHALILCWDSLQHESSNKNILRIGSFDFAKNIDLYLIISNFFLYQRWKFDQKNEFVIYSVSFSLLWLLKSDYWNQRNIISNVRVCAFGASWVISS